MPIRVKSNHHTAYQITCDDPQAAADLTFLALTIWREARGESWETQSGIAHCVLNRVQRPSWWGKSIMFVLFKKWQFSSLTDPKDRQLTTWPSEDDPSWAKAMCVAAGAMSGNLDNPVPGADSYHDVSIPPPAWSRKARFVGQFGKVRFYDVDRDVECQPENEKALT